MKADTKTSAKADSKAIDRPERASSEALAALLSSLAPELLSREFVFCTVPDASVINFEALSPLASFQEKEGLALVLDLPRAQAAGFSCDSVFRCITLGVYSPLDAVGLTAAVSTALTQGGISANVIAAYHHDYIFVPADRAQDAMAVLESLAV